jgi:hypothetical protein
MQPVAHKQAKQQALTLDPLAKLDLGPPVSSQGSAVPALQETRIAAISTTAKPTVTPALIPASTPTPTPVVEVVHKVAQPAPVAVNTDTRFGGSAFQRTRHESFMTKVANQKKNRASNAIVAKGRPNVPRLALVNEQQREEEVGNTLPSIGGGAGAATRTVDANKPVMTSQTARGTPSSSAPKAAPTKQVHSARADPVAQVANPTAAVPNINPILVDPPVGFGGMFTGAPEGFGIPVDALEPGGEDGRPNTRRSRSRGRARQRGAPNEGESDNTGLEISGTGLAPEPQEKEALLAVIPITAMDGADAIKEAIRLAKGSPVRQSGLLGAVVVAASKPAGPMPTAAAGPPTGGPPSGVGGGGRAGRNIVHKSESTETDRSAGGSISPRKLAELNKANALGGGGIF